MHEVLSRAAVGSKEWTRKHSPSQLWLVWQKRVSHPACTHVGSAGWFGRLVLTPIELQPTVGNSWAWEWVWCVCVVQVSLHEGTCEPSACVSKGTCMCISVPVLPETALLSPCLGAPPGRDKQRLLWRHRPSSPGKNRYLPLLASLCLSRIPPRPPSPTPSSPFPAPAPRPASRRLAPAAPHHARPSQASPAQGSCEQASARPFSLPLPPLPPEITSAPLKKKRTPSGAARAAVPLLRAFSPSLRAPLPRRSAPPPPPPAGPRRGAGSAGLFLGTMREGRGPAAAGAGQRGGRA